jgi:hypothetical protein
MFPDLEVKVRWGPRAADVSHLLAAADALTAAEVDTWGIKMAIEGQQLSAIGKGVPDDDDALVPTPAKGCSICDSPMANTIDRCAKATSPACPPIFSSMVLLIAAPVDAEISSTAGYAITVGRIQRKIEDINQVTIYTILWRTCGLCCQTRVARYRDGLASRRG